MHKNKKMFVVNKTETKYFHSDQEMFGTYRENNKKLSIFDKNYVSPLRNIKVLFEILILLKIKLTDLKELERFLKGQTEIHRFMGK